MSYRLGDFQSEGYVNQNAKNVLDGQIRNAEKKCEWLREQLRRDPANTTIVVSLSLAEGILEGLKDQRRSYS